MSETKRLTVEMIREAVEKTGYRVVADDASIDVNRKCGCPFGVWLKSVDPDFDDVWIRPDAAKHGFAMSYTGAFMGGFDGGDPYLYDNLGFADGLAARAEFVHA